MANAGLIRAQYASVRLWDAAGASWSMTDHGNTVTIARGAATHDSSAYGDNTDTNLSGRMTYTINYSGWWAGSDGDGSASRVEALVGACGGGMIQINPAGSAAGSTAYVACVNVIDVNDEFPHDGIATLAFTCNPRAGSLSTCPISVYT